MAHQFGMVAEVDGGGGERLLTDDSNVSLILNRDLGMNQGDEIWELSRGK
ncbi:2-succinyl-5-enolpyruvyl-6-hydroxy-3-cyclohexene-1-carboxylic-acid [Sesbania bispinosa]|nr:2-succinyl-5-enolpyruvyl-6-hydroxy-3-cyclohexene-1-carboxylic-acid [Sesbania bispinosa]